MRALLVFLVACCAAACDAPPIEWADPISASGSGNGRLVVDSAGHVQFVPDSSLSIQMPDACPTSVRTARGTTQLRAVWWGARHDSSAVLYMAASSDSGKTWGDALKVDTVDVSLRGCARPPPSVAAVGDDLHIAYSMTAPEGTGVFFAHFLGSMVHSPVAVIYGDRLVSTAIAAEGNRVVVAYEDPNGPRRAIGVALSSSQGHIFEAHTTASRDIDDATSPAVAVSGSTVAMSWMSPRATDTTTTRIVRLGRIR